MLSCISGVRDLDRKGLRDLLDVKKKRMEGLDDSAWVRDRVKYVFPNAQQ